MFESYIDEGGIKNKIEKLLPRGSMRRGIVYIGIALTGLYFVGDRLLQERTSEVNGQIDQTGQELSTQIDKKISPATEDLDSFMSKANGFFEDYEQFRIDICMSVFGEQMDGCQEVLDDYFKSKISEEASNPTTTIREPN